MSSAAWERCWSWAASRWLWPGRASLGHYGDEGDDDDDGQPPEADRANDGFEQGEVAAQEVAGAADDRGPRQASDRTEELEAPERHVGHAGKHRSPRPEPEHEARRQDRPIAVPGEEQLRAGDVLRPDAEEAAEPLHERAPAPESEVVAEIGARGGPD